jgi:hypothetical protein
VVLAVLVDQVVLVEHQVQLVDLKAPADLKVQHLLYQDLVEPVDQVVLAVHVDLVGLVVLTALLLEHRVLVGQADQVVLRIT